MTAARKTGKPAKAAFPARRKAADGRAGPAPARGARPARLAAGERAGATDGPAPDRVAHLTVTADHAGQRLDNFLIRVARGVPKSHVYRIVRSGEVRVNRGRADADYRLQEGDDVRVPPLRTARPDESVPAGPAPALAPPVLYEDADLLVIDKPAGVAAHGGSGVAHGVIERVRAARPRQAFLELAHRLDRETSGILLLAKSRRALLSLHEQLREGLVDKRYLVLVAGDWVNDRQHVRLPLTRYVNPQGERRVAIDADGMHAHTIFSLRQRYGDFSLLEAELKTGRTHQIRVHLAHLGFPIVGDDKYGDFELNRRMARGSYGRKVTDGGKVTDAKPADAKPGTSAAAPRFGRMFLHAAATRLAHPVTGETLALETPLPEDCRALLHALERASHD